MPLSRTEADATLARLDKLYADLQAHMRSQWYAIGSGQPDMDLGALRMVYTSDVVYLRNAESMTISGAMDSDRWRQLAIEAEKDMRDISGYTDDVTIKQEVATVAGQTGEQTANIAEDVAKKAAGFFSRIVTGAVKGAFLGAPILFCVVVAALIGIVVFIAKADTDAARKTLRI